jgi:putative transposase
MTMTKTPKHHRYPVQIISQAVWLYHRFNHSYRDVQEQNYRFVALLLVMRQ